MTQRSTMSKKYMWVVLLAVFLGFAAMIALLRVDLNCDNNLETPKTYAEAYAQAYDYYDKGVKHAAHGTAPDENNREDTKAQKKLRVLVSLW